MVATQTLQKRQNNMIQVMLDGHFDGLVLNPGPSLVYLTDLHFHLSERPVVVFFSPNKMPIIVLPELEVAKVKHLGFSLKAFQYGENPATWVEAFKAAAELMGTSEQKIGIEPGNLRYLEYSLLKKVFPSATFESAEEMIAFLRMVKDEREIENIQRAVDIAQDGLKATLPMIKPGITEKSIARELTLQLLKHGSFPSIPFSPIVSSGPNSANPHAIPSDRTLQEGDLLVIDYGAMAEGYFSDITRTFAIGKVDSEYEKIAKIILASNEAGRAAVRPNATAGDVDTAARTVIEMAGYGEYFFHRTGHGFGLEGHEPPYIRKDNDLTLKPGMTFTVEPGIYLPNRNGVRIEDDIVVTSNGVYCFTNLPRELIPLPFS